MTIQPKLAISTPGDMYEQEADRFADQVMRMPEPQLQRTSAGGGEWQKSQTRQDSPEHLQTKPLQANHSVETAVPPVVHEFLNSSGQPLDAATRAFMEPRFGHDLSRVRVHTDERSAEAASAINARAFTSNRNIVFGRDEYAPATEKGRLLLAHELVHTKQQLPHTLHRKIIVGGAEEKAAALLPAVTSDVNTWYTGIVTTLTTQMGASFNAATDIPFTQAEAVARAGEILQEMENAKFEKQTVDSSKKAKGGQLTGSPFELKTSREQYDFNFDSAQDVSTEVLFRLSLMLNMSLANKEKTAYARYPQAGETGLNLQDTKTWTSISTQTEFEPGGFQLEPGTSPAAAITQLTAPVANVQQRIAVDCSTLMGILHYKSLLEVSDPATFNAKLQNKMIVGPLQTMYGAGYKTFHPLKTRDNPAKKPYMKEVSISKLEDLVPGDTVMFMNHHDYKELDPGGLWSGEYAVYNRKEGKTLYFEGFGVPEDSYDNVITTMRTAYATAWNDASPSKKSRMEFKPDKEPASNTIEGVRPGIQSIIFRIDLAAYNK